MQCPSCGTDVRAGQKFCAECGTSLGTPADDATRVMAGAPSGPQEATTGRFPTSPPPDQRESPTVQLPASAAATNQVKVVTTDTTPVRFEDTDQVPFESRWDTPAIRTAAEPRRRRQFRLRPLLLLAILGAAAVVVGAFTTLIKIDAGPDAVPFEVGTWMVNDFGTNNAVAGVLAGIAMVVGSLAWCVGYRWGAGLAGGAGAALAGWVALLLGLAEWPIANAEAAAALVPTQITRDVGYWALIGAGAVGLLVLIVSFAQSGRDGRSGLDPWIAALGAVSFLIAAIGPLIPEGTADWSANFSSDTLVVELPTMFFVGRLVQLGLLALIGVFGFLLVRRYGLGLAVGAAVTAGWMLVTAATETTDSPIGPGFANPGAEDLQPHAVTIVGFAMIGFFALVAIGMALLDGDR
jgi:zinc-ribbon domain